MASLTRPIMLAALTALVAAFPLAASAQSQADFDACNRQAAAQTTPVAGGSITSSSPGPSLGGSTMTAPGSTDVNRAPNASGRISGNAGSPGSVAGTGTAAGGGTPSSTPSPSTAPSASPSSAGSVSTSASGSASASASTSGGSVSTSVGPGTGVTGMADAGRDNPAYQQAFRDCLKSRGF